MLLREFIQKYPKDSFDMMTPGGFVFLTPEQAKELLAGKRVRCHPGDPSFAMHIDAEELLSEKVVSAKWENHVCHMFMDYPEHMGQEADQREVEGMQEHDQEQKFKERLKANYEAYIQQLKQKPVPDLIEMASEIATARFIYEELSVEGAFSDYADYLLQFENPLDVLKDGWIEGQNQDHHEKLDYVLWNMAESGFGEAEYPMTAEATQPVAGQGVIMC